MIAPAALTQQVSRLCAASRPAPDHAPLIAALERAGCPTFVPRLSRGGWFRPGRILDAAGQCVAAEALPWLEAAWAAADGDGERFGARWRGAGYVVTHEQGSSHYLVAPCGVGPADYLQLEVEELQETVSHLLVGEGPAPDSVEALLERRRGSVPPCPLGAPHYRLRRIVNIADHVGHIAAYAGKAAPVLRFLDEWAASSAGAQARFCEHWVLSVSEHLDRYRQPRYGALPVAARTPAWAGSPAARGVALAHLLHDFDRAAGYSFAWYFHMVSGHRVPRALADAVAADLASDLAYLPERDAALVSGWTTRPYSL